MCRWLPVVFLNRAEQLAHLRGLRDGRIALRPFWGERPLEIGADVVFRAARRYRIAKYPATDSADAVRRIVDAFLLQAPEYRE